MAMNIESLNGNHFYERGILRMCIYAVYVCARCRGHDVMRQTRWRHIMLHIRSGWFGSQGQ